MHEGNKDAYVGHVPDPKTDIRSFAFVESRYYNGSSSIKVFNMGLHVLPIGSVPGYYVLPDWPDYSTVYHKEDYYKTDEFAKYTDIGKRPYTNSSTGKIVNPAPEGYPNNYVGAEAEGNLSSYKAGIYTKIDISNLQMFGVAKNNYVSLDGYSKEGVLTYVEIWKVKPELSLAITSKSVPRGDTFDVEATIRNDYNNTEGLPTADQMRFTAENATLVPGSVKKDGNKYTAKFTATNDSSAKKVTVTAAVSNADNYKDDSVSTEAVLPEVPVAPVTPVTPVTNHTVTFHPANGQDNFTQTVADGNKVSQPADPTQDGYTFNGWYTDSAHTNAYDFDTPVNKDIDLYAKWTKNNPSPNPEKKVKRILLPKVIANGSSEQTFTWTPLTNVDGYFVYEAYCNTYKNVHPFKKVADVSASSPRVYKRSGLKKGAAYKYYVAAYQIKDGKKQIVKKSVTVHSAAGNLLKTKKAAYTNVKNVSVKKNAVTLKIGKTYKIQPSVKGVYSGYAILQKSHAPMYRYLYIKDGKNISVDQNGNVKALKAGKCNVYVLGTNGVRTKVAVTVK